MKQLKDNPDIAYVRKHLLRMDTEEAMELKRDIVRRENVLVDTLKEEVSAKTYKLVKLKSAVDAVIAAQMPKAFGDLIDTSIELVRALEELEEMKHLVLSLDSRTIAEIKSFKKPLPDIIKVMRAVFILLGTDSSDLESWSQIVVELGRTGRESLKRRIQQFDVSAVDKHILSKAAELITGVDGHHIRKTSEGAAVFYKWALSSIDTSFDAICDKARKCADEAPAASLELW